MTPAELATLTRAIDYAAGDPNFQRVDIGLANGATASIYWTGTVLRIDLKGMRV